MKFSAAAKERTLTRLAAAAMLATLVLAPLIASADASIYLETRYRVSASLSADCVWLLGELSPDLQPGYEQPGAKLVVGSLDVPGKGRYRPGDVLPDGRIAGAGPGAALANGPDFHLKGVLLGEFMPRVRAASKVTGLRAWSPRPQIWDDWVKRGVEVQKNKRWLRDQIRSGADIYSLGKTPGFARGDYFRHEVTLLLGKGYRRRFIKTIDVPGFGQTPLYRWIKR